MFKPTTKFGKLVIVGEKNVLKKFNVLHVHVNTTPIRCVTGNSYE